MLYHRYQLYICEHTFTPPLLYRFYRRRIVLKAYYAIERIHPSEHRCFGTIGRGLYFGGLLQRTAALLLSACRSHTLARKNQS